MAICGYARVSTKGQKLEAQLEALKAAGVDDDHLWQEKASGAKDDRPELAALLKFVRKGDTVVATKLDRLARSTRHLLEIVETLEKRGVTLQVLNINLDTSQPTGRLMLTMLAGIAQFERELMLERQAEGFAVAKAAGRIKGRPDTARAKVDEIKRLATEGLTKKSIAEKLGIGQASVYRVLKDARKVHFVVPTDSPTHRNVDVKTDPHVQPAMNQTDKIATIEKYIKTKSCFGLHIEAAYMCKGCHLAGDCAPMKLARLEYEERLLNMADANAEVEAELAAMQAWQSAKDKKALGTAKQQIKSKKVSKNAGGRQ